jgi:hypothetical protein
MKCAEITVHQSRFANRNTMGFSRKINALSVCVRRQHLVTYVILKTINVEKIHV